MHESGCLDGGVGHLPPRGLPLQGGHQGHHLVHPVLQKLNIKTFDLANNNRKMPNKACGYQKKFYDAFFL